MKARTTALLLTTVLKAQCTGTINCEEVTTDGADYISQLTTHAIEYYAAVPRDVVVVDLGLAVGLDGLALGDLALKAGLLIDGVVQLAEGIAVLGAVDEILEALGESRIIGLALGQRAARPEV